MDENNRDTALKKYYSEWWENPKDIRNVVFDALNEYVRNRIPDGYNKKALDIGSGHGRIVSYLVEKGYDVTAVEYNSDFVTEIKRKYPGVNVIEEDVRNLVVKERYDLVTCIELIQNLQENDIRNLLSMLSDITGHLFTNISNYNSLHGRWVNFRHFIADFVHCYTPSQLENWLKGNGFNITHRRGIGLLTPLSLFNNFQGQFIPGGIAELVNRLDPYFTRVCHLYYIEAESD